MFLRYIKLMSRLTKRYLRHTEDSTANAASREKSGALSLVYIVEILRSDWLNLIMLVPRSMP